MIISNNIAALNANRNYQINTDKKTKSTKKLSSGYRINMAADDAAGITISEKMRWQIRGLNQGTRNAQDGVSWVQTGEAALGEVQNILHRMKELTIQSLNDTNTESDRAALQAEFDALQSEIDRIGETTQFNTKSIFEEHEPLYHEMKGNIYWNQGAYHSLDDSMNTLTVEYKMDDNSPTKKVTISVAEGTYTTQELIDEIDDALRNSGATNDGIVLEYGDDGCCNLSIEGGKQIESISGGLSYLLNDMYTGGSVGALIGTTIFKNEFSELEIRTGKNDNMEFEIQSFDGAISKKNITIPEGNYTRQELMDYMNQNLTDTSIKAVKYSTGIKLQSDDCIITGFKGNMFKIDKAPDSIYTSVFYDNVMYGYATMSKAEFKGGAVITSDSRDVKNNHYTIDNTNNLLTIGANGEVPVTLTIAEGNYTVREMADVLNNLFVANNINVTASAFSSGSYSGLNLISGIKGLNSSINIDTNSGAYQTLFTKRVYTDFVNDAQVDYEKNSDKIPYVQGGKTFKSADFPLAITSGVNDEFCLNLDGQTYNIKMGAGSYSSVEEMKNILDEQLNGSSALAGYKGKLEVSVDSSGRLLLKGRSGSGLVNVSISEVAGNQGYDDLFVGKEISYKNVTASQSGTSSTPAQITLNTPVNEPMEITDSNNKLNINVNGSNKEVTLPNGSNVTHNDIIQAINTQLPEKTIVSNNKFSNISVTGNTVYNVVKADGKGITQINNWYGTDTGESTKKQGVAGEFEKNIPATLTIPRQLGATTVIDSQNAQFTITVNGTEKTVELNYGAYTQTQLQNEIQKKMDAAYGANEQGVSVTVNNSQLVFSCRLDRTDGTQVDGSKTSLSIKTDNNPFLKELFTTRTAAVATSTGDLQSSVTIDSQHNKLEFKYNDGTSDRNVVLSLSEGTYSRSGIVEEINRQLRTENIEITASLSGNKLCLTTKSIGNPVAISYVNSSGGNSAEALFGALSNDYPASATANCDIQDNVVIDDDTDVFNISVDGNNYSLILDKGIYDKSAFVTMLNQKMTESGVGLNVSLTGSRLTYTTISKGNASRIDMTYASGGSSMKAIYGEKTTVIPGVVASFTSDNKLQLTGTVNGGSLSVSSDSGAGSLFQTQEKIEKNITPTVSTGFISSKHAYIDGVNISEPVEINEWNNVLKFNYVKEGSNNPVEITLEKNSYTYEELKNELQNKLNVVVGNGELDVTVNSAGVHIETTNVGSKYVLNGFDGGFYYNVLCSSTEHSSNQSVSQKVGGQRIDSAYTIGRRDVKNSSTIIEKGMNDELTFDFTYGGTTKSITMKLDAGSYVGNSLTNHIQEKLNEQLANMGFQTNLIKVGIGEVTSGVYGSNDENALCIMMNQSIPMPAEGEYIIDGVRGSAAFHVFYQSDGKMVPAYSKGTKDITEGVEITNDNNQLSIDVDGITYSITLDDGKYNASGLVDEINKQLTDASAPISAKIEGDNLKLFYNSYGAHIIDNITGSARRSLFFQENKGDGEINNINIQLSSDAGKNIADQNNLSTVAGGDCMTIEKVIMNTVELGINSIVITKNKYANKALNRLDIALDKVSSIRSMYGAIQNRLEHAIAGNNNAEENIQKAESLLRDADMPEEMMEYAKRSILEQTGQAILAQANSGLQGVLSLLQ